MKARPWIAAATLSATAVAGCRAHYLGSYDGTPAEDAGRSSAEAGQDASGPDSEVDSAGAGGDASADTSMSPDVGEGFMDREAAVSDGNASDRGDAVARADDMRDVSPERGDASAEGGDASAEAGDASIDRGDSCSMAALPEPVAYYSFDDCTDDSVVLRDSTSHMNFAEKRGRVGCVPGHRGFAILIDGEGSPKGYVNIPNGPDFQFTDQLTAALWVSVLNAQYQPILSKWYSPDTFILHADGDTFHFSFAVPNPADPVVPWQSVNVTAPLTLHAWVHLAAVFDRGVVRLYLDGRNDVDGGTAVSTFTVLQNTDRPVQIGAMTDEPVTGIPVAETFTGLVDELRIYNQALTPCQITALASQ